jgi:hypothetical protein
MWNKDLSPELGLPANFWFSGVQVKRVASLGWQRAKLRDGASRS